MPSWKKVITSGSAAAFSSLVVSSTITGSISGSLTGSLFGTASWAESASQSISASRSTTASFALSTILFPFTGSATITGSLVITGSTISTRGFTGSLFGTASYVTGSVFTNINPALSASYADISRRILTGVFGKLPGSDGSGDSTYQVLVMRDSEVGVIENSILAATASLKYSGSLDLLYTTSSWALKSITASYALTAPGITPQGDVNEIQYNVDGTNFGGVPALTYDGTDLIGTGSFTGSFNGNLRLGVFRGARTSIPTPASKGSEVLVYTQHIPAATFTDNDIIRVHYRINQLSSDTSVYRIYIADTANFDTISGSLTNLITNVTASPAVNYIGIKRDLTLEAGANKIHFMNSGSTAISDDTADIRPVSTFDMDWNNTDYWMYFSAIPNDTTHVGKALSYSIERI